MKKKTIAIMLLGLFLLPSTILMTTASATTWPNLPSSLVQMKAVDGTESYFVITLSGINPGFDVQNGDYPGWCIDRTVTMVRGVFHSVTLYSSLSPSPPVLTVADWIAINYILNHKEGTMMDVQNAIWHYTDDYTPPGGFTAASLAMTNGADANPGYDPLTGTVVAVICIPQDHPDAQNSIIELPLPQRGKVTGGGQCIVGENKKIPSASFGFNAMWFSKDPTPKGEINYIDHITGQHVHVHDLTYLEVWQDEPGNKPWPKMKAKFGGTDIYSGFNVDVYVEDHGEPGKNDKFLIFLNGEYLGGSGDYFGSELTDDKILAGNIQIHRPPK